MMSEAELRKCPFCGGEVVERLINKGIRGEFWVSDTDYTRSKGKLPAVMEQLYKYETAEEEGRLIVLPCKVGSAVYLIWHRYTKCSKYGESFEEYSCSGCEEWDCDSHKEYYIHVNQSVSLEWIVRNMQLGNFGKTVFLTKEEAEKALKEMEEDDAAN